MNTLNKQPFNFFDKIVCLSFDPNRWDSCTEVFKQLGISERVIRYKGDNPLEEYINRGLIPRDHNPNSIDAIHARRGGCTLSHFNILRMAKQNNFKNVLIFEDDIINNMPPEDLLLYLDSATKELPVNWEMFYPAASPAVQPINYSAHLCKTHSALTTHSISINSTIFDKILEEAPTMDNIIQWTEKLVAIDTFYSKAIHCNDLTFMCKKLLINQKNCFSDIDKCVRNNGDFIKQSYNRYEHLIKELLV